MAGLTAGPPSAASHPRNSSKVASGCCRKQAPNSARAATGCIHHSDRGSQCASDAYQAALNKAKRRCSTTDGYDCCQNALAERVNGILKDEFLFVLPDDGAQARLLVDQAGHRCNEERPHLALNYLTPHQVHQQAKSPAGKSERGPCLIPVNKIAGRDNDTLGTLGVGPVAG